jgi:outer membrane receptor protein involved in Fe transport
MHRRTHLSVAVLASLAALTTSVSAQTPDPSPSPAAPRAEYVEVTATRIPEDIDTVPVSIQVITAQELRDRGATDLKSALALVAGVDIAPGADVGPAASVPEFWGLKEFDAFLLVVDGVPWGGAFNPALGTLNLNDVERIEVQHGPAPVMYGATSFVGVIQVIRRAPGAKGGEATATAGSYGSGGGSLSFALPAWAGFASSLSGDFDRQGFRDDRTSFKKGHVLWRNLKSSADSAFRFDVDLNWLRQQPASPTPQDGAALSAAVPLDSNQNPAGAFVDEDRYFFNLGYDKSVSFGRWSTTASYSRSNQDVFRGFLLDATTDDPNANGFREKTNVDDFYFDTHLAWTNGTRFKGVAGVDYLYGHGQAHGGDFDYFINLDGSNPPTSAELPPAADIHVQDHRNFGGLYGQLEWLPSSTWRIDAGARLNVTKESRATSTLDFESGDLDAGQDDRTTTRPSGSLGITWTAWQQGSDSVHAYASWQNTYKPSAVDFGLDSEPEILKPETSNSYEAGLKADLMGNALRLELSGFLMDFNNLVIAQSIDGLPALTNAGQSRLKGIELSLDWRIRPKLVAQASYSYHDARFTHFVTLDDEGEPLDLAGHRLETSPHNLAAFSLSWSPENGIFASGQLSYVGSRFLDQENTLLFGEYATLGALVGYRHGRYEVRGMGRNLTDRRDGVSTSELGEGQAYRLFPRRFDVTLSVRF